MMARREYQKPIWPLFALVLLLMGIGALMVLGTTTRFLQDHSSYPWYMFQKHMIFLVMGSLIALGMMKLDYHTIHIAVWAIGWGSLVLLVITLVLGQETLGASRRVFGIQPSELAKLALILITAHEFSRHESAPNRKRLIMRLGLFYLAMAALIISEPDYSTLMMITLIFLVQLFLAGISWSVLLSFSVLLVAGGGLYAWVKPHALYRLSTWISDFWAISPDNYQVRQSLIALGRGGLDGVGLGQSLQKLHLPMAYNDFVFSIVGEEGGFIGTVLVIALFALLLWFGARVILDAPDTFGRLLGAGALFSIFFYALVHMGIAAAIFPSTGLPLPFVSYGGTNLLIQLFLVGLLMNISTQRVRRSK